MLWATEAFLPRNLRQEDLEMPHLVPGRVYSIVDLLLRAVKRRELNRLTFMRSRTRIM